MSKKSDKKKPPKDINQLAAYIVKESTKEGEISKSQEAPTNIS
jgi:hypothetical protein